MLPNLLTTGWLLKPVFQHKGQYPDSSRYSFSGKITCSSQFLLLNICSREDWRQWGCIICFQVRDFTHLQAHEEHIYNIHDRCSKTVQLLLHHRSLIIFNISFFSIFLGKITSSLKMAYLQYKKKNLVLWAAAMLSDIFLTLR